MKAIFKKMDQEASRFLLFLIASVLFAASLFYGAANIIVWNSLLAVIVLCWFYVLAKNTKQNVLQMHKWLFVIVIAMFFYMILQSFFLQEQALKISYVIENISLPWEVSSTTTNQHEMYLAIYKWLLPVLVLFLIPQLAYTKKQANFFLAMIIAVGFLQACLGLAQFLTTSPIITYLPKIEGSVHGSFINRNTYACFLSMIAMLSIAWLVKFVVQSIKKSNKNNALICVWQSRNFNKISILFISTVIIVLCIFLSVSRGAILSFLAGSFCFLIIYLYRQKITWKQFSYSIKSFIPLALVLFLYLYLSTFHNIYERFSLAVEKGDVRSQLWEVSGNIAKDYPLGTGGRNFYYISPSYNKPSLDHFVYPHNDYLQFFVEYGFIGVLLLAVILMVWLRYVWIIRDECVLSRSLWTGAMASCVVIFCHGFVDFSLQVDSHRLLLAAIMGLLITRKKVVFETANKNSYLWLTLFSLGTVFVSIQCFSFVCSQYLQPSKVFDTFYENRALDVIKQRQWMLRTIDQLKIAQQWNEEDPNIRYKTGFLYYEASRLYFAKKNELLKQAQINLEKAQKIMPNNHKIYIHLAKVYFDQKRYKDADKSMITGVLLGPYDEEYASEIAKYWLKRWQQTKKELYIKLIADRFLVMSRKSPGKLERVLKAWGKIVANYDRKERWYNVIFPAENYFAIHAAKYFLNSNNVDMAKQMTEHIKSDSSAKFLLKGHISVYKNELPLALDNYSKVDINEKNIQDITQTLIAKKHWREAINIVKSSKINSLPLFLSMAKQGLDVNVSPSEIENFLVSSSKKYGANAEFFYLRAIISEKKQQLSENIMYAEKAVEYERKNFVYLIYLLESLLKRKMWADAEARIKKYSSYYTEPFHLYKRMSYSFYRYKLNEKSLYWAKKAQQINNNDFEVNSLISHIEKAEKQDEE